MMWPRCCGRGRSRWGGCCRPILARPYQGSTRSGVVYNAVAVRGEMTEFLITTRQGVDAVIKRAVWRGRAPMPKIDFSQAVTAATRNASALAAAKTLAHARAITLIEAATATITGPVPLAEMLSWTAKEEAARRLLTYPEDVTDAGIEAILGGEAALTGETIGQLAIKIIANADAYRTRSGHGCLT